MNHAFPIVNVLFAPDDRGKMRPVNGVVTLASDKSSICLRADGSDPHPAVGHGAITSADDVAAARAALKSALGAK